MSMLYLGTNLEGLADLLVTEVEKQSADLFEPVTIVTPHRYMARWLRLRLAKDQSVAINLRVEYLFESVLWQLLTSLDAREHKPTQLSGDDYRLMILATLLDDASDKNLADYMGDVKSRRYWRRAWHLAGRLATLLRDYEFHRQESLLKDWRAGQEHFRKDDNTNEFSQKALFDRLVGPGGLIERFKGTEVRDYRTLPEYAREVMALPEEHLRLVERPPIHFFGLGQISALHVKVVHWLGQRLDLRFYHFNPILGGLDKLPAKPEAAAKNLRKHAEIYRHESRPDKGIAPELRHAWGRAGAESLGLMARLLDAPKPFAVKQLASKRQPVNVLHYLQNALLGTEAMSRIAQDTSVQIVACPGIVREIETVHASILNNLMQDENLRLTDIAVLVPDMASYRPLIQSVFDRPPQSLPYNLADYSAAELSVFGRGVMNLLDLALESFTRSRVFDLLLNPCCLAKLEVERPAALAWLEWAEKLGIFHGWDGKDRTNPSQLFTWQLGLRRLRLGRIMDTGDDRDGPVPQFGGIIPFADLASGDADLLDSFSRAVQGLLPRLARLRTETHSGREWAKHIRELVDDFLAPPDDRPEETHVRDALFQSLEGLATLDRLRPEKATLALTFVREFIRESLETLKAMRGQYLTGGVTIAAPQPLLPTPFKIIYMIGLGEGHFPGSDSLPPLDLRGHEKVRQIGDIRPAEGNRFLLMHAILAAKEKLYLTYNSRDLQRDQELHPCGPLNQLRRALSEHVLAEGEFKIATVPLSGSDPVLLNPGNTTGVSDVRVCLAEADRLLALQQGINSGALKLNDKDGEEVKRRIDAHTKHPSRATNSDTDNERDTTISISELAKFLRDPAEAKLKRHLHLRDEDQPETIDDEPFTLQGLSKYGLVRSALQRYVKQALENGIPDPNTWQTEFNTLYTEWQLRGLAPEAAFGDADREKHWQAVRESLTTINDFLTARVSAKAVRGLRMGESYRFTGAEKELPHLAMAIDGLSPLKLVGHLEFVWISDDAIDVLVVTASKADKAKADRISKYLFEPALFHLTMRAHADLEGDWAKPRAFRTHVLHAKGMTEYRFDNQEIAPDHARAYLNSLIEEFLDTKSYERLPFDMFEGAPKLHFPYAPSLTRDPLFTDAKYQEYFADELEDFENDEERLDRANRILGLCDLTSPTNAYETVKRRYGIFDCAPAKTRK